MKEEDRKRQAARRRKEVAEWLAQALQEAGCGQSGAVETKIRAIAEAAGNEFPTADIDVMLDEIEAGRTAR